MENKLIRNLIVFGLVIELILLCFLCEFNTKYSLPIVICLSMAIVYSVNFFNEKKSYYSYSLGRAYDENRTLKEKFPGYLADLLVMAILPLVVCITYLKNAKDWF